MPTAFLLPFFTVTPCSSNNMALHFSGYIPAAHRSPKNEQNGLGALRSFLELFICRVERIVADLLMFLYNRDLSSFLILPIKLKWRFSLSIR